MTIPLSATDEPIGDAAVREALDRVLASPGFAGSLRLRRFLRYVVERQLAGEGAQLKEYAVGVEVFDRQAHYDPRLDSIVRVEAGRLRAKLEEYYSGAGAADAVRIGLPRGSYVPAFARMSRGGSLDPPSRALLGQPQSKRARLVMVAAAALLLVGVVGSLRSIGFPARTAGQDRVSIAVLPFQEYSGSEADVRLADRITDEVTTALARLGRLSVVSRTTARQFQGVRRPLREIAKSLEADFIVEAAVNQDGEGLFIEPRLVDARLDRKVWVGQFRGTPTDSHDLATRMAEGITDAVMKRQSAGQD